MGMMDRPPLLEIRSLTAVYPPAQPALEGITLCLRPGELTVVIGESGCGKTTLGLCVLGLSRARVHGQMLWSGQEASTVDLLTITGRQWKTLRGRQIAMAFQHASSALNPVMRIGRQMRRILRRHFPDMTPAQQDEQMLSMLRQLGFHQPEAILHQYPHELSGGMCQRVMVALSMLARPAMLIADEPTASLDAEARMRIMGVLHRFAKDHHNAVMIFSHDVESVEQWADHLVVLYAGRIVEAGKGILSNPAHPYTQLLLQSKQMLQDASISMEHTPENHVEETAGGCAFYPYCRRALPICRRQRPVLRERKPGHDCACHIEEVAEDAP